MIPSKARSPPMDMKAITMTNLSMEELSTSLHWLLSSPWVRAMASSPNQPSCSLRKVSLIGGELAELILAGNHRFKESLQNRVDSQLFIRERIPYSFAASSSLFSEDLAWAESQTTPKRITARCLWPTDPVSSGLICSTSSSEF